MYLLIGNYTVIFTVFLRIVCKEYSFHAIEICMDVTKKTEKIPFSAYSLNAWILSPVPANVS